MSWGDAYNRVVLPMKAGIRIIEDWKMTDAVEDWSRVRSPSRAERRRRQGHRQNIRTTLVPKPDAVSIDGGRTFVMHPETAKEFYRKMERINQQRSEGR